MFDSQKLKSILREISEVTLDSLNVPEQIRFPVEFLLILSLFTLAMTTHYETICGWMDNQNSPTQGCVSPESQKKAAALAWFFVSTVVLAYESRRLALLIRDSKEG